VRVAEPPPRHRVGRPARAGHGRSSWTELGGFAIDPDTTKKTWDEYVRALPKMWTQERFAWDGVAFSMPERAILPKPVQDPHPPLWVTVTSPGTELDAADRGLGCLGVAAAGFAEQERRTREYHRRIRQCEPVSSVVSDKVATLASSTARGRARRRWRRHAHARPLLVLQREPAPDAQAYPRLQSLGLCTAARRQRRQPGRSMRREGIAIGIGASSRRSRWERSASTRSASS
jgi:alkanesulfonate monooxygenase SsuD/methylene tetrahydromethanopterin reductase-like flavin-dependent oxidoreductase (luciferase family)